MGIETERRYLLPSLPDLGDIKPVSIMQGYLFRSFEKTVRIRVQIEDGNNVKAFHTEKGPRVGISAQENEWEIPLQEAIAQLVLCGTENILSKDRYKWTSHDGLVWEVDSFKGDELSSLVIAEVELPSEETIPAIPVWMNGVDISLDRRFANAALIDTKRDELFKMIENVLVPAGITPPKL